MPNSKKLDFGREQKGDFGNAPDVLGTLAKALSTNAARRPSPKAADPVLAKSIEALGGAPVVSFESLLGKKGATGKPLLKALGDIPTDKIKAAAAGARSGTGVSARGGGLVGGGEYSVAFGDRAMSERDAREACSKAIAAGLVNEPEATCIEHCLNNKKPLPRDLAAKLFQGTKQ